MRRAGEGVALPAVGFHDLRPENPFRSTCQYSTAPARWSLTCAGSDSSTWALKAIFRANEPSHSQPFDVVVRPQRLANRIFTLTRADERLTLVNTLPRAPE